MSMFVVVFTIADIMSKFSARFDAKAAKDAKGKGKANPLGSPSVGGAEAALGKNSARSTSVARDSPLGGKALAVVGTQKGGEARQSKRQRILQGKPCVSFLPDIIRSSCY
jgi:hypothetical protein